MKLLVLGANGRTGAHVVRLALEDGLDVTAMVRSEAKRPSIQHERFRVFVGDPCDPSILSEALQGQDAAISTLGGRLPTRKATSVYHLSAKSLVEATRDGGPMKLAVTSSALLFQPKRWFEGVLRAIVPNVVRSATRMEQTLRAADLNLVIARCGFLTNADETKYRAREDCLPEGGSSVSRQSLARFLIDAVGESRKGCHVFGVSSPDLKSAPKSPRPSL